MQKCTCCQVIESQTRIERVLARLHYDLIDIAKNLTTDSTALAQLKAKAEELKSHTAALAAADTANTPTQEP